MNKDQKRIQKNKEHRQVRVRAKIFGTAKRPRLCVFKSNKGLFLQLIDDQTSKTLVSVDTKAIKDKGTKLEISAKAGELLAKKAEEKGIKEVVFDRRGNKYHGRVKSVADVAREAGLQI